MPSREQLLQVINIQTEIAKLGLDLGGVMQYVVEQTLPLIDADGAAIELAEEGDMVYRAASGIAAPQLGLRLKVDASLSGLCIKTGEVLTCIDAATDTRVDLAACNKVGLRSMLVMPLTYQGATVGVLKAVSRHVGKFQQPDITLLNMLSEAVAAAMYFSVKYDSDNLFFKATHDCMTGLANRALFMDRLHNAIARAKREQLPTGLLMMDMDGLKQINDTHGHRAGDAVLLEFAKRLQQTTRDTDLAARLGGDEFGVILTPQENPEAVTTALQRIEAAMASPLTFEGRNYQLQVSIGAIVLPQDGMEPDQLLELADKRMYAAKNLHKNQP
ncbi:sensor domain-containing diguanylate cyclase [Shewanella putrefaciens]|uniref:sensor domain-containing diguanylate cyclase n=1 Tax=Shewanella putrefaciens TaxID=24 RepID=UPI0018E7BED0|nr:sensor domain-containing diguanylate cyclase [Shewanella putrefaciens]